MFDSMEFARRLKIQARTIGFDLVGITSAAVPTDFEHYLNWIQKNFAADMHYMQEPTRVEKRRDLKKILPGVQSVIVGAFSYAPKEKEHASDIKFARYGWGKDYHEVVKEKLDELVEWMKQNTDEPHEYRTYTDTGPILERSLAERAGVGWIGKNTCVIHEKIGSYVFLGEILTTLPLPADTKAINRCGTCTRCIDACPTQAIEAAYQLNAGKCISYQTIENRKNPVSDFVAEKLNGWIAGCDICQEVCPWNNDVPSLTIEEFSPLPHSRLSASQITSMDEEEFQRRFATTSFKRIGLTKLQQTLRQAQKKR